MTPLLLSIGALILGFALFAPVHQLLFLDLILVTANQRWEIGGVFFDSLDLVLVGIAVSLVLGPGRLANSPRSIPFLKLWLLLLALLSLSYLLAPYNQEFLTDPARAVYQVYRYAWRLILYYPLAFVLVGNRSRVYPTLLVILVVGALCALIAIPEGYQGVRAGGPFRTAASKGANALGAALIVPLLVALSFALSPQRRIDRILAAPSILLIIRAVTFAGSRGAMISMMVGGAIIAWGLLLVPRARTRVVTLGAVGLLFSAVVLIAVPDLFDRPNIKRVLSISEGVGSTTLLWRVNERWGHFGGMALENPWLGRWITVDRSLGPQANTPHNGYLELALQSGFPALAIFLFFPLRAIVLGFRVFRSETHSSRRTPALLCAASLIALLIHNLVESHFLTSFPSKILWILIVLSESLHRTTTRRSSHAVRRRAG